MDGESEVSTTSGRRFSRIERVIETDSTNEDLLDRARRGERADLVRIADHQRKGRGRQGRPWVDRPGASMLMSVLLRPDPSAIDRGDLGLIPLAAGLAAGDALGALGVGGVGLKWPNDVLVIRPADERKLAGILSEATSTDDGLAVVVGTGLNLDLGPPSERPDDVAQRAIGLTDLLTVPPSRDEMAELVLSAFADRLAQLNADRSAFLEAYRSACISIGRFVELDHPSGVVKGEVRTISDDGGLVLATIEGEETFTAGAVHHRRPGEPGPGTRGAA